MRTLPAMMAILVPLAAVAPATPAAAQEAEYPARFDGEGVGGGPFRRNAEARPLRVKCALGGNQGPNRMSVAGKCRAAVIFSRDIGADLTFDPSTGRYTGIYTGVRGGASTLSGERRGDTVRLTVTWPKIVNGDRTADMEITNNGNGMLRIVVTDKVSANGPTEVVSDLTFSKRTAER